MKGIKAIVLTLVFSFSQLIYAQASPVPMLENSASQIISTLKQNKNQLKNNKQIIYQAVEHYLLPNVDVNGMSRSVLGRAAWLKASNAERQQFSKAFTQLVIRTYASPLAEYSDETIKFLPIRGSLEGRFIRVNSTIIRSKGNNIALSYSLVANKGKWQIYDLSVEGVSLLQSFRSQFAEALRSSDMKNLIKQMNDKKAA
ncbi:MAG: ABC transporter substrate-binding protein [Proteobacteria bacterium]|nr:ABC transporter substrate-binding protein [Pseudomonadota bacterium]